MFKMWGFKFSYNHILDVILLIVMAVGLVLEFRHNSPTSHKVLLGLALLLMLIISLRDFGVF